MSKLLIATFIIATSSALILMKLGTKTGPPFHIASSRLQFNLNFFIVSGILLYGISFLIYTFLISRYDLGYIIPLTTAFVYIVIFTASAFIFNEIFTATKIIGIALIVVGLVFLNFHK